DHQRARDQERALRPRHHCFPALRSARPARHLARHPACMGLLAPALLISTKEHSMARKFSPLTAAVLAALGMALPAAAQQQGVTDTEIVIGDILPLTGPPALLGVAHNLGVK